MTGSTLSSVAFKIQQGISDAFSLGASGTTVLNSIDSPIMLPSGATCPVGVVSCYALVLGDNGLPIGDFNWTDTFNGMAGGIVDANYLGTIDPESGAGGITIVSIDGVSETQVPEPASGCLLIVGLLGAVTAKRMRATDRPTKEPTSKSP